MDASHALACSMCWGSLTAWRYMPPQKLGLGMGCSVLWWAPLYSYRATATALEAYEGVVFRAVRSPVARLVEPSNRITGRDLCCTC